MWKKLINYVIIFLMMCVVAGCKVESDNGPDHDIAVTDINCAPPLVIILSSWGYGYRSRRVSYVQARSRRRTSYWGYAGYSYQYRPSRAFVYRAKKSSEGGYGYVGFDDWCQPVVNSLRVSVKNKGTSDETGVKVKTQFRNPNGAWVPAWGTIDHVTVRKGKTANPIHGWNCSILKPGTYPVEGTAELPDRWQDDNWNNDSKTEDVALYEFPAH